MSIRLAQNKFNGGIWSPLLEGRTDLAKHDAAVVLLENMLVLPHGPIFSRPGTKYIHHTKNNGVARLIPFVFSVTQAYQLEVGDSYIRIFKNKSIVTETALVVTGITKANPAVLSYTGTDPSNNDRILVDDVEGMVEVNNREFTVANVDAGNNTFELSGINSSSYTIYTSGGIAAVIYEILSPYAVADLDEIKLCQSADVLYLWHPDYAPRKLSRTGHTSWVLSTINFIPGPTTEDSIQPATTLTLGAVTGTGVTFTAGSSVFLSGDVGRLITSGVGRASITAFVSGTVVTCDIMDDFSSTGPIASGSWAMLGTPNSAITPSKKEPIGAICKLTSTGDSETLVDLLIAGGDNWTASGNGTDEYYIPLASSIYSAIKPDRVYIDGVLIVEGIVGSLGILQWGHGNNDALGGNTIYIRLADGSDPDSKSTGVAPDNDFVQKAAVSSAADVFRSADVGKYVRINSGFVRITSYTSVTVVKGEIIKALNTDDESTSWTLESDMWSSTLGYPSTGVFFEERLVAGGSTTYPETVWGSVVGDYENHTPGIDDSDAFQFTLSGRKVNVIRWMEPREYLLIGTAGSEWRLGPEDTGSPLTPLNVVAKQVTTKGCYNIEPISVNNSTLFLQRAAKKILELAYDFNIGEQGGYTAPDMTILAEHLTQDGISGMAYQQEPFSTLWCYTSTGELLGLTYLRKEEVVAWHKHPIDGDVKSLSSIPEDNEDELWMIVKRTINGSTVRYIEVLEEIYRDDADTFESNNGLNAFFVDSGKTYNGTATTTISGLWHLRGEAVSVLANGGVVSNKTVSAAGTVTIPVASSVVHIGKGYTGKLQTMRPDLMLQDGPSQGKRKQIIDAVIRVNRSGTFKAGRDEDNLDEQFDRDREQVIGQAYPLFTGDIRMYHEGEFERDSRIFIAQDKPLPLTIVGIFLKIKIG